MSQTKTTFLVSLRPGEDGLIIAECANLPGCISQGRNRADAIANIREAIQLCLESGDHADAELVEVTVAA